MEISCLKSAFHSDLTVTASAFYKGESQEKKQPRRLEGAKIFAALSSPGHVL